MILKTIHSNISIIITAAGSSTRIGNNLKKEYLKYKNGTVISACTKTLINSVSKNNNIIHLIITYPENKLELCKASLFCDKELESLLIKNALNICFVQGDKTRQSSVFNALQFIKNNNGSDFVLIHDGARPFVKEKTIQSLLELKENFSAITPGLTPTDTIKQIDKNGIITKHLKRNTLFAVQTPQLFRFNDLYLAHQKALQQNTEYTDDTEIFAQFQGSVKTIIGDEENIKITYPKDLEKL